MTEAGVRLGEPGPPVAPPSAGPRTGVARWRGLLLVLVPVAAAAARYGPILENYFFGDDFLNLYHIVDDPLPRYLVTPNGGHVLLVRNAIFYLTWLLAGTDPRPYFWSVLLTHLLNVALLFAVLRRMTARPLLASFLAMLWGTSPLNEGTLGWYAVYGHALVATALLVIVYQALRVAETGRPLSRRTRVVWYVLALAASSCFGTGTAIAIALPFVLWLLLPPGVRGPWPPLLSLVVTVPVLYVAQVWAYQHLSGTDLQSTTVLAKLLADQWVIARFGVSLVAFGLIELLAGPVPPGPPALWYAVLAAFALGALAAARSADVPTRRRLLACVLLVLTVYGIIALGRGVIAVLLLGTPPDAVRHVPRYQYVGQLVLALFAGTVLSGLAARRPVPRAATLFATGCVALLGAHLVWDTPLDHHADSRAGAAEVVAAVRETVDAAPPGGTVRIPNRAFVHLPLPAVQFPGWAAVFTIFFPDNVVDGRRVLFIDSRPELIEALRSGRRTGALLVPPMTLH